LEVLKKTTLRIIVDDQCIFDLASNIKIADSKWSTDLDCVKRIECKDGVLDIEIQYPVTVHKASTHVSITEISMLEKNDNVVVMRSEHPIHKARVHLALPDGWEFKEIVFPDRKAWNATTNPSNVLVAECNGWIAPDLLMGCVYEKNEAP
jgi:hypothetical protein